MNLFTKQKQTHGHRKQTYGYQRGKLGVWGGIDQEFGIDETKIVKCIDGLITVLIFSEHNT